MVPAERRKEHPITEQEVATIQRLEALATDKQHLRQAGLQLAGSLLQDCGEDVVQLLISELDEDVVQEEGPLYQAYEQLFQSIAKEVIQIGRELSQLAKSTTGTERRDP